MDRYVLRGIAKYICCWDISIQINAMSNEEMSIVAENMSVFAFPSNFHHLRRIDFKRFREVEVVFEIQSLSNRDQLVINEQQPLPLPLLPNLEDLRLEAMHSLTHVWKCNNWNKFFILHKHQPQSLSFHNLTTIILSYCNSIKYLFSPLMVKHLSNLKAVEISSCEGMKEVVSNQDDEYEDEEMTTFSLFPHLELLKLYWMVNLKHIGGGVTKDTTNVSHGQSKLSHWSLCQYSRKIHISACPGLSSVIPSYAAGRMQKLQELSVGWCNAMEEVFETVTIPRPTNSIHVHKLPNLKKLEISHCNHLKYIFTFSTLESLKTLETLTITDCKALEVIVREEYGEGTMTSSKDMNIIFPNLKSIKLYGLTNLKGFFLGMNIHFQWPLLDYVMISDCPQMMKFTSGRSTTSRLKNIYTKHGKHNLECGINFHVTPSLQQTPSPSSDGKHWSFHNLIECNLDSFHYDDRKIFPSNELQHLQKLETIKARNSVHVEEVFEVALEVTNNESQTVVKFPNLREVHLDFLPNLKCIWKSNQWRILEFPNLTTLAISNCPNLEHVFTCSMVGCVMQLQKLHIEYCHKMKVVVKEEEEEDCDAIAKVSEIKFPCLKSLKLNGLSSLKGFWLGKPEDIITLPSLDTLVIKGCREITVFTEGRLSTPKLTLIETGFGSFNVNVNVNAGDQEDINTFIMTKKQEGYEFGAC